MLPKVRDALVEKFKWHVHSVVDDEEGCHLSDRCNENVVLTMNEAVYNRQPPWVTLSMEV